MPENLIDLRRVAELIRAQGTFAEVWMTGGGVHTLYAGPTQNDRYALAAGPADAEAKISVSELVYGPDTDDLDEQLSLEASDEPTIAKIFLDYIATHTPPIT